MRKKNLFPIIIKILKVRLRVRGFLKTVKQHFFVCFIFLAGTTVLLSTSGSKINTSHLNYSCKLLLVGKTGGIISTKELRACTHFTYLDSNLCSYQLKSIQVTIQDKMGTEIISQTTPIFLDDLKNALDKVETGTRIFIEAEIWINKNKNESFIQTMKFVVQSAI